MEIKEIEKKENQTKFLIKGTNTAFINAIRRTIMKDIPIFAIEDLKIYENDSILFDEFLGQRLGLLPVKTDLKTYKKGEKTVLILEKEGPGMVYSKDIRSVDPKIEIIHKNIPLVKLRKGERIKIEMDAVLGTGKEHVKWQPAIVSFKQLPNIFNSKKCNQCKQCIKVCPKNVLEIKAKKIVLKDPINCTLCNECVDTCKQEALKLELNTNDFVFLLESHGALKAKEIMAFPLVTIEPETSVDEACKLAARKRIKRLPVVENGMLIGIVSIRDLLTRKPEYVREFYF